VSDALRVSDDGRVGVAEITLDLPSGELGPEPAKALAAAVAPARSAGLRAEVGGEAVFLNTETAPSGAEAVGVVVALVVLVVAFGTLVAALVPIALALVAVATGLSAVALLAGALDVSSAAPTIAAMVGLGVGIDYALFIVSRYRENRAAGARNDVALSRALATSGTAVLFAGLTVVLSMAALVLTGLGVLASIGLATALVVLLAVATALTLLPALLSLLGDRIDAGRLVGRGAARARRRRPRGGGWRTGSRRGRGPTSSPPRSCSWRWRRRCCRCRPASPTPATSRRAPRTGRRTTCSPRASARASTPRCSSSPTCRTPGCDADDVPALVERLAADPRASRRSASRGSRRAATPSWCRRSRPPRRPTTPPLGRSSGCEPVRPRGRT
jgi:RND superfamily putative drug exporter